MRLTFLTVLIAMSPTNRAEPVDYARLISAIAEIEQGRWGEPGGICNIGYTAWSDASDLPYQASGNPEQAIRVYYRHLDSLSRRLRAAQIPVTPDTLGTCWRWGFSGAQRRHWKSDQGQRTQNLYADPSLVVRSDALPPVPSDQPEAPKAGR